MHNRRFGTLLMGAWLIGTLMVWFVTSQSLIVADGLLSTPPLQIQKELADLGPETAGNLLHHQGLELNRRMIATWEIMKIGISGALLVTSVLTAHRSRTALSGAAFLLVAAAISAFYISPTTAALGRSLDFLPAAAALPQRAALARLEFWHRALDVVSTLTALVLCGRLLFDFYEFRMQLAGTAASPDKRKRRRRPSPVRSAPAADTSAAGQTESGAVSE